MIDGMEILRYAAFSSDPSGGNPAGVVLDAGGMTDQQMQTAAAEVGFSETAFLTGNDRVRYFSPLAEVAFCGHATIAMAVAYARRHGTGAMRLNTKAGIVDVITREEGGITATLVSVEPLSVPISRAGLEELLDALGWRESDLDRSIPPRVAFAGVWHPIIAAATRARLSKLDYDFGRLGDLMRDNDWTTVNLIWRESPTHYHARNPFPPGGVTEDPATGAAAAALGGYLRELGHATTTFTIHQGYDMGRPSEITVTVPPHGGIAVTGTAVPLDQGSSHVEGTRSTMSG